MGLVRHETVGHCPADCFGCCQIVKRIDRRVVEVRKKVIELLAREFQTSCCVQCVVPRDC